MTSNPSTLTHCRACGAQLTGTPYLAQERMLKTGEEFLYHRCTRCGARSIDTVPEDLARFYPATYSSFGGRSTAVRKLKLRLLPDDKHKAWREMRVPRRARVLDVGCGVGVFVRDLADLGYASVTGIDPFLPDDQEVTSGPLTIRRAAIDDMPAASYDAITLHHVLEHTEEPTRMLVHVRRLLVPGGAALVRTPLADSWAAEEYGADWIQHDPPRHLVVHTSQSVRNCAEKAGLRLQRAWRDEGPWQAWAGAALAAGEHPFTDGSLKARVSRFRHAPSAARRNKNGTGDQGCFVLTHA